MIAFSFLQHWAYFVVGYLISNIKYEVLYVQKKCPYNFSGTFIRQKNNNNNKALFHPILHASMAKTCDDTMQLGLILRKTNSFPKEFLNK
jgi:hypothetical protein